MSVSSKKVSIKGVNRFIFISTRDVSLPKGPSVNERELILDFLELYDESAIFLLPLPSEEIDKAFDDPRVHYIKWDSRNDKLKLIKHELYIIYFLFKRKLTKNDLVYIRINKRSFGVYIASYFLKFKLILRHFSARSIRKPSNEKTLHKFPLIKWLKNLRNRIAQKAILIETCTKEHKETVIDRCDIESNKVIVVTNGVNTSRVVQRSIKNNRNEITVGYIGGTPELRGGKYVIRLVKALQNKAIDAHGIVIGGLENEKQSLKKYASDIGIQNNLTLKSAIPYDQVFTWLARLDIGVAMNSPELLELVGNANQKLRQYLATGVFVISDPSQYWLEDENVGLTVSPIETEVDFDMLATNIYRKIQEDNFRENCIKIAQNRFSIRKLNNDRIKLWQETI